MAARLLRKSRSNASQRRPTTAWNDSAARGSQVVFDLHTNTPGPVGEFGAWTSRLAGPLAKLDQSACRRPPPHYPLTIVYKSIANLEQSHPGCSPQVLTEARLGWWETNTAKLHDMSRAIMEALDAADLDRKVCRCRR